MPPPLVSETARIGLFQLRRVDAPAKSRLCGPTRPVSLVSETALTFIVQLLSADSLLPDPLCTAVLSPLCVAGDPFGAPVFAWRHEKR
jgi:hypothetical protein